MLALRHHLNMTHLSTHLTSLMSKINNIVCFQNKSQMCLFICLFGVLRRFQHFTGHITMGSWKGRGNQYIQFARVLYCKLPTNGKQLPSFPLTAKTGIEPQPQRWEARVLPLCHRGPTKCAGLHDLLSLKYPSQACDWPFLPLSHLLPYNCMGQ